MAGINDALVDHDIDLDSEEEIVESLKAHIAKHFSKDPPYTLKVIFQVH